MKNILSPSHGSSFQLDAPFFLNEADPLTGVAFNSYVAASKLLQAWLLFSCSFVSLPATFVLLQPKNDFCAVHKTD
jgi:hypothetical protein